METIIRAKRSAVWMLAAALCLAQPALMSTTASSGAGRESGGRTEPATEAGEATRLRLSEAYGRLPLSFEENRGQADASVRFVARGMGFDLLLKDAEAILRLSAARSLSSLLRMKLKGASAAARIHGTGEAQGKSNYFIGNDQRLWRANVRGHAGVRCERVYPGIDVVYYGSHRQIEYDFNVAPGADFKAIRVAFEGARRLRIDPGGDLVMETAAGEVRHRKPVAYQVAEGGRVGVAARFVLNKNREVGFEVGRYDRSRPLVIDPVLIHSTYLGGSTSDSITGVAVDSSGNAYLVGGTDSINFPVTTGAPNIAPNRVEVAFVTKMDTRTGRLVYSTYIGGQMAPPSLPETIGWAIALDSRGSAYITGYTSATDFPTTPGAFQTAWRGTTNFGSAVNAFVTKLNQDGSALIYSTYLGGSRVLSSILSRPSDNRGNAIAVDSSGSAYVAGGTNTIDFPTTGNAPQPERTGNDLCGMGLDSIGPCSEGFITKLNPSGSTLVYSTYLGGSGNDACNAVAVDAAGNAYVAGTTEPSGLFERRPFPTVNPLQQASGGSDAFVAKLNPSGTALIYSTHVGGSGQDMGNGLVVDSSGNAYLAGTAYSTDMPVTPGAFQPVSASNVLFKTTDGGAHWAASGRGVTGEAYIGMIAVDAADPSAVYAAAKVGSLAGVFRSSDGGDSWEGDLTPNSFGGIVKPLAFYPRNPLISYFFIQRFQPFRSSLFRTEDGGRSVIIMTDPSPAINVNVLSLAVDPTDSKVVYVSTPEGLFKSLDGGLAWKQIGKKFPVGSLLWVDPANPSTLYAALNDVGTKQGLYRSVNGGKKWKATSLKDVLIFSAAFDPTDPSRVYAGGVGIYTSDDGGATWQTIPSTGQLGSVMQIIVDPHNPSTVYASTTSGVFKSADRGKSWGEITPALSGRATFAIAIDPVNPSTLYAGTWALGSDGFVAKLNPSGTGFSYVTYLGGSFLDWATAVAVDSAGGAYIVGGTNSPDFPAKDFAQSEPLGIGVSHSFLTKLNPSGTGTDYSSRIGPALGSLASAVAVDSAGRAYVGGVTNSPDLQTTPDAFQRAPGGQYDGFLMKFEAVGGSSINGVARQDRAPRLQEK